MERRLASGIRIATALALCLFTPRIAPAHQVWLETEAGGVRLHFGEFADNQREVSPGYLDKLVAPAAQRISSAGTESMPPGKKGTNAIRFKGAIGRGQSVIAVDPAYPLIESRQGDRVQRTAWTPAARYMSTLAPEPPQLTLDIVPGQTPGEFQVYFRGAALRGAEATLVAASGWSRAGTTDETGKITFTLPWKGTYALLVRHKDATPGKRVSPSGAEETYDVASFATTLTFVMRSGLPSPPPPPAAPPNSPPPNPPPGKPSPRG